MAWSFLWKELREGGKFVIFEWGEKGVDESERSEEIGKKVQTGGWIGWIRRARVKAVPQSIGRIYIYFWYDSL